MKKEQTVMLFISDLDILIEEGLTDEDLGAVMRTLYMYKKNGECPTIKKSLSFPLRMLKSSLDRCDNRYEEIKARRSQAGKKGMKERWSEEEKMQVQGGGEAKSEGGKNNSEGGKNPFQGGGSAKVCTNSKGGRNSCFRGV